MKREAGAEYGCQYRLLGHDFRFCNTERCLDFSFFKRHLFADFIGGYFADAFEVTAKPHAVLLDFGITQFSYPVCYQAVLLAEIDDHLSWFYSKGTLSFEWFAIFIYQDQM